MGEIKRILQPIDDGHSFGDRISLGLVIAALDCPLGLRDTLQHPLHQHLDHSMRIGDGQFSIQAGALIGLEVTTVVHESSSTSELGSLIKL